MGLSSALLSAVSGLHTTQAGVEIVSRNIANADTPGYTRKIVQQVTQFADGEAIGVRIGTVTRILDQLLQDQLRSELSDNARANVIADSLARLDAMFGVPGGEGSLDTAVNSFASALQELSDSPDSAAARAGVVTSAQELASRLNDLSNSVQGLRRSAEAGLADATASANQILDQLAELNGRIGSTSGSKVDLLDQRDTLLAQLSDLLSIEVQETDQGGVRVFTTAGNLLVDGRRSVNLVFDASAQIGPTSLYSSDPLQRGVGALLLDNGSGQFIDLFNGQTPLGGVIGGYRDLRDDILVDAQGQLDALAQGLASAFSENQVAGTAVSAGPQNGFDLDVSALLPGDEITISYTRTPPGSNHTVTVIRVDDPALLPLSNSQTANPGDTVIGIDFSAGAGAAAAALGAALGGSFTVLNPGGDTLRILDDGLAGAIDISSVSAGTTATGTTGQGLGLGLFTDGPTGLAYSGALEGGGQGLGFAARISVNPAVTADDRTLVIYSTSPPTALGDQSRPQDLLARLTERSISFTPVGGLGSTSSPLVTTIDGYARSLVAHQTGQAAAAEARRTVQNAVTNDLGQRVRQESGVDVDEELSRLVVLQNAYAANARVISVIQELFTVLSRI